MYRLNGGNHPKPEGKRLHVMQDHQYRRLGSGVDINLTLELFNVDWWAWEWLVSLRVSGEPENQPHHGMLLELYILEAIYALDERSGNEITGSSKYDQTSFEAFP